MSKSVPKAKKKSFTKRPPLRACLVYWDAEKSRFRITTPKTARTCKDTKAEVVLLLTEKLEKRDLRAVEAFQATMSESEIGMTCTKRGRISFSDLQMLATE
jgi:hypothetical protein